MDHFLATPPKQREVDQLIHRFAARQHWAVSAGQLRRCGLTHAAIQSRLARGQLIPVHHGVYKLSPGPLTDRGMLAAAVLASTPAPLISRESAVGLYGLARLRTGTVHVTTEGDGSRSRRGIIVHRSRCVHPDDRASRDRIPVTSIPRTLVDIAGGDRNFLRRTVEEAEKEGLLVPGRVLAACDRANGKPGIDDLRKLITTLTAPQPTDQEMERRFAWLCRDHFPAHLQPKFNEPFGRWKLDAYWPWARLAVELDSVAHHSHRTQIRRDLAKNLDLADAGIDLIRLGWIEVNAEAERTASMLLRRLDGAPIIP